MGNKEEQRWTVEEQRLIDDAMSRRVWPSGVVVPLRWTAAELDAALDAKLADETA